MECSETRFAWIPPLIRQEYTLNRYIKVFPEFRPLSKEQHQHHRP